ncbi:MAG: tol-pal system protein YbgF [Legionella sp.]|nr:tol-pal system protein YbgF [Legionella sp.]
MIFCKKYISIVLTLWLLPMSLWSAAPVVDKSDDFAMREQQEWESPPVGSRYNESKYEGLRNRSQKYTPATDETPLVKEDFTEGHTDARQQLNASASLIDKIQSLRQEIQELRGQLEIQAHDLKLLQQQQIAFYKDLDSRLATGANKIAQPVSPAPSIGSAAPISVPTASQEKIQKMEKKPVDTPTRSLAPVSRMNPADEQISYLAAYELIKNKRFDEALAAMQRFAQNYPQGGYTANAEYWIGELYLLKKEYAKSIEHFEIVLDQFPTSSKGSAAMLKDGYAYAAAGDVLTAKKRLQQVIRSYPNTKSAQLASIKLESIDVS